MDIVQISLIATFYLSLLGFFCIVIALLIKALKSRKEEYGRFI